MKQRCEDYGFQIDLLNEQMVELRGIVELQSKEIEELKSNHNQRGEESTPSTPSTSTTLRSSTTSSTSTMPKTSTTTTGCTSTTIGRNATTLPTKCASYENSRILHIQVPGTNPFKVPCHMEQMDEPAWIVILKRSGGHLDFHRNWTSYRNGFGDLADDHFLGLEKLHRLTRSLPYELLVKLTDFRGNERYALYSNLLIGNEQEKYKLKFLGEYSGDAGDAMSYHLGNSFTTYDEDNDGWPQGNCANYYDGAWWYGWDANCNLMGQYYNDGKYSGLSGIWWFTWKDYASLQSVKMMIRPSHYTLMQD